MKKLILAIVFVFATGTMMNANSSNYETIKPLIISIEVEEDFGCASDCVRWARAEVFEAAGDNGDHPNDHPVYMEAYMFLYTGCYNNCN